VDHVVTVHDYSSIVVPTFFRRFICNYAPTCAMDRTISCLFVTSIFHNTVERLNLIKDKSYTADNRFFSPVAPLKLLLQHVR